MKILSINPGSTSTKIAVYENETPLFVKSIEHPANELAQYENIIDQFELRKEYVLRALEENGVSLSELSAVVGRGGQLPPVKSGGYYVNQDMIDDLRSGRIIAHASNLGAPIAYSIASPLGIPAYIYDAVASDELADVARITGLPEIKRQSFCHVLNSKAMARKAAAMQNSTYVEKNYIVAHMGGGVSISAHEKGRIIDTVTADGGPFSPERAGSIPLGYVVDICYSGKYTQKELMSKLNNNSGLKGLLGTSDCREIERRIAGGDDWARDCYEAQAFQISKGIGSLVPTLGCDIDAIILTGGLANSEYLTAAIARRVERIAPVIIMPGENEMESLTLGALRILRGEEPCNTYIKSLS